MDFNKELADLIMVILTGLLSVVTTYITKFFKKKGIVTQLEAHKELVKFVVNGVEQVYTHLHGKEKLEMAKIKVINLAKSKGIKITEEEIGILIEAMVKEMNEAVKNK